MPALGLGLGLPYKGLAWGGGGISNPIPGLGALSYYHDWRLGSLVPTTGPTFTLTRASATTSVDLNDLVVNIASGQPRWWRIGASSGITGISVFGAHTNVVLWSRDLTNAAWTASNVTVAKTATGADGVANSASTLTATAGNGTVLQAITLGSSARSQETYVKRRTGSGVINMTTDNGTTWTAITVTASWAKVRIPVQTLANPTVGFRIVTSGDAIDVDYVTNTSVVNAPVIETTTAAVTVNADVITASGSTVINQLEGTPYVEAYGGLGVSDRIFFGLDDGTNNERLQVRDTGSTPQFGVIDGGATLAVPSAGTTTAAGVLAKMAARYRLNDSNFAKDGATGTADTSNTMPTTTTIRLNGVTAGNEPNTVISVTALSRTGATDAALATATA